MAIKFIVYQDAATRKWHWRLRSAANDADWAVSGPKGYTRKENAVKGCALLWSKLAGFTTCPRVQINASKVPALVDAFGPRLRKPAGMDYHPSLVIGPLPQPCPECGIHNGVHRSSCSKIGGTQED